MLFYYSASFFLSPSSLSFFGETVAAAAKGCKLQPISCSHRAVGGETQFGQVLFLLSLGVVKIEHSGVKFDAWHHLGEIHPLTRLQFREAFRC